MFLENSEVAQKKCFGLCRLLVIKHQHNVQIYICCQFLINFNNGYFHLYTEDKTSTYKLVSNRGGAGTVANSVQVGNTTFMWFIKCQLHIITMLLYPHKLLILLYYLDNICWWRCQCRLIRNASIVCYPLAPELSAKDFWKMASGPTVNLKNLFPW